MARKSSSRSTSSRGRPAAGGGSAARRGPLEGDTLLAGVILGAHGLRGELRVSPDSDNPERFRAGGTVLVDGLGERAIASVRGGGQTLILRLEGIADRESAAALEGRDLRVPLAVARAEAAGYLWADLVGMRVEDEGGRVLGTLVNVLRPGGVTDVFVVHDEAGREVLLPAIEEVVRSVDVAAKRMTVRPQEEA